MSHSRRGYFLASFAIIVVDQLTKIGADHYLRPIGRQVIVPDLFNLTYSRNPGGLFGYFGSLPDFWRVLLLTLLPVAAVGMITWFLARSDEGDRRTLWGLSLILGGAVGNLIDRVVRGEVIDFLDVYVSWAPIADRLRDTFGTAHWPTFNIADSAIVVGAGLLLLTIVRPPKS